MVNFINEFLSVLGTYVRFLFSLEITSGVSMGSVFLVATILFLIVDSLWVR